ncbi:MAG: hypothetical protein RI907_712 [Pseudomonadota bacterium]|jgi:outer membrane protein
MKPLRSVLVAAMATLVACSSYAQELKIGVVNLNRIMRDSMPARMAQSRLDTEFKRRETELQAVDGKVRAWSDKLQRDTPTMAESERARRQREVDTMERELQRKRREFNEDIDLRRNDEMAALQELVAKAVRQVGEQEKYDLILQQEAPYVSARVDITDKVIKAVNAGLAK